MKIILLYILEKKNTIFEITSIYSKFCSVLFQTKKTMREREQVLPSRVGPDNFNKVRLHIQ